MARVAGTKRMMYDKDKVRQMRSERKTKKAKVDGVDDNTYQMCIGDLIGAGHLSIKGFEGLNVKVEPMQNFLGDKATVVEHEVKFKSFQYEDRDGSRPHLDGYLTSGHPNDPKFKLKGWFNEDGTIRIELVK